MAAEGNKMAYSPYVSYPIALCMFNNVPYTDRRYQGKIYERPSGTMPRGL